MAPTIGDRLGHYGTKLPLLFPLFPLLFPLLNPGSFRHPLMARREAARGETEASPQKSVHVGVHLQLRKP